MIIFQYGEYTWTCFFLLLLIIRTLSRPSSTTMYLPYFCPAPKLSCVGSIEQRKEFAIIFVSFFLSIQYPTQTVMHGIHVCTCDVNSLDWFAYHFEIGFLLNVFVVFFCCCLFFFSSPCHHMSI